jgi:hypothetical protein
MGAEGGERTREREGDLQAKCPDRTVFFDLISRNTILWM